ncbi:Glyceraldehyde-3-phosphate ketol-isomerase [Cronobacter sakazakii 680]|nr:Glyceraldehyde-3-phosphate ketol-isomerase [Cronobacter sakazakii 680]
MKIAFDVDVIKDLGITRMVQQVAEWGYQYIEQSPHPQINPFYKHPKAGREVIAEYKKSAARHRRRALFFYLRLPLVRSGRTAPSGGGEKLEAPY